MNSKSVDETIQSARSLLRAYLEASGVSVSPKGTFCCINPDHDDQNPSANIVPGTNEQVFHCHACNISGNVFTAAHLISGLPLSGTEFVTETIPDIYKTCGLNPPEMVVSPEMSIQIATRRVHKALYELLKLRDSSGDLSFVDLSYAHSRGWREDVCLELGVGSFNDYQSVLEAISASTGERDPKSLGITRDLVGPDLLTFILRDHNGSPVALAARRISGNGPKYMNSDESLNTVYSKGKLLYGLDIAKKFPDSRLDIFEGYADFVTAYQAGHRACVAVGGIALTKGHVDLLIESGFSHVNVVFDADEVGESMMYRALERFSGYQGLVVSVTPLPKGEEKCDVDSFIRENGLQKFLLLPSVDAFEYKISSCGTFAPGSTEAIRFVRDVIPLLLNTSDRLERGKMASILSRITGVDRQDILAQVEFLEEVSVEETATDISRRLARASSIEEVHEILQKSIKITQTKARDSTSRVTSLDESVGAWLDIFREMDDRSLGLHGWTTGYDYVDELLDGIAKPSMGGTCYGIAGAPQSGKSAIMLNIALNVARLNSDATVLYWAIDDHRNLLAYRLLGMLSGVSISKIRRNVSMTPEEEARVSAARDELLDLTRSGRFVVKDERLGREKLRAEQWIRRVLDHRPDSQILFCVDSLHNVAGSDQDMRTRLIDSSGWVKGLTVSIPVTVMMTLEMIKNRGIERPTLQQIAETGKIEFDLGAIFTVWNEAQARFLPPSEVRAKWKKGDAWMPMIEADLQKNKTATGRKGTVFFELDTDTTCIVGARRSLPIESLPADEVFNRETAEDILGSFHG